MTETPRPVGRPSTYTQEIAQTICERMAEGESLRAICRDPDMPDRVTVLRWVEANEEFRNQYARATEYRMDAYTDEMIDIVDISDGDVQRDKLRVDTRKWIAERMHPRKYGSKVTQELTGKGGKDLIPDISDTDLVRRIAWALTNAEKATA